MKKRGIRIPLSYKSWELICEALEKLGREDTDRLCYYIREKLKEGMWKLMEFKL